MRLQEVNILRTIAIVSIVIWHCFVCPLGIWGLNDGINNAVAVSRIVRLAYRIMPEADMPLFTFISGFLFSYLMKTGKYPNIKSFVSIKMHRLLIPFFIIGTVVCLTAPERYLWQIVWGEGSHLWFCAMLFWCFMITIVLWCINNKLVTTVVFGTSLVISIYFNSNWEFGQRFMLLPLGIHNAVYFYAFFHLGGIIHGVKPRLDAMGVFFKTAFCVSLISICILSFGRPFVAKFYSYMFVLTIYILVNSILGGVKRGRWPERLDSFCELSFGIYVFHEWLSWDLYHIPCVAGLLNEFPIPFASFMTVAIFTVSVIVTRLSLKTRVGRYLLL